MKAAGLCTDLFFAVKITDAAKRAGVDLTMAASAEKLLEHARGAQLVVLDLACRDADPLAIVRALKSDAATRAVPVTGFLPHVMADLAREARDAGCDRVMARSAFAKEVTQLFANIAARP